MSYTTFHDTFTSPDREVYGIADSLDNPLFTLERYTGEYANGEKCYEHGPRSYRRWSDTFYRAYDIDITADMPEHAILCAQAEAVFSALDAISRHHLSRGQAPGRRGMNTCTYFISWRGPCGKPAVIEDRCEEHQGTVCVSCGKLATHECSHTMGLVCGQPLCPNCEHTEGMGFNHQPRGEQLKHKGAQIMTPDQLNRRLAELLGLSLSRRDDAQSTWYIVTYPNGKEANLPNFCNDLNAVHLAEQGLNKQQVDKYTQKLAYICGEDFWEPIPPERKHWHSLNTFANALQRTEALIKTLENQ